MEKLSIKELIERHDEIVQLKKSAVKFSDPIDLTVIGKSEVVKELQTEPTEVKVGDYIFPVINTTNWLDSHGDVHIPGIWNKSIKEQQGKVHLVINHDLKIGSVIGYPKDVEPMVKEMKWSDLGVDIDGTTEALIFKTKLTESANSDGLKAYMTGAPVQHSIRMMYDQIHLCIKQTEDSDEDELKYNENWDKYYPQVVNKEDADSIGYFWAVTSAKIFKEGSQVLFGSNEMTPTLYDLKPSIDTSTKEEKPSIDTQTLIKEMFNFKV